MVKERILSRANRDRLLDRLREEGLRVFGPRLTDGLVLFLEIQSASELAPDYRNSTRSIKDFFLPPQEPLLRYGVRKEGVEVQPPAGEEAGTVLFGVRPCDAAYLPIIDRVFSGEEKDQLYLSRREKTLIIGLSCETPEDTCFCTSLGYSPGGSQGCDLLLTPLGEDRFFVEFISERGEQVAVRFPELWQDASASDRERRRGVEAEAKASIQRRVDMKGIKEWLDGHFDDPLWEEISRRCLGCAACYYLCPTCHCFDIVDEGDMWGGTRRRIWDSCSFGHFTQMPAHQPRETQARRYRQRIMHKFKYYVDRFGIFACVGCGRCLKACPVGIDLTEILGIIRDRLSAAERK